MLRELSETVDQYDKLSLENDENYAWDYLKCCAKAAWDKCELYYSNKQLNWRTKYPGDVDLPPAYYASHVLDPYRKWQWFYQEWVQSSDREDLEKNDWFQNAQKAVKELWEEEYLGRYPVEVPPPKTTQKERAPDPAFDRQRDHKRIRVTAPIVAADLYETYISTDRLVDEEAGTKEAIHYWNLRYDSQRELARFALDMLAVNPMSDECERLFSSARQTVTYLRGSLYADTIEACECLRHWLSSK